MRRLLIGLAVLGLVGWFVWLALYHRVTISNQSGQPIRSLTVYAGDSTFHYSNLAPGWSWMEAFGPPDDDNGFTVEGVLEDGTRFDEFFAYMAWEDRGRWFSVTILPCGRIAEGPSSLFPCQVTGDP